MRDVEATIADYVAHARAEERFGKENLLQTRFERMSQQSKRV